MPSFERVISIMLSGIRRCVTSFQSVARPFNASESQMCCTSIRGFGARSCLSSFSMICENTERKYIYCERAQARCVERAWASKRTSLNSPPTCGCVQSAVVNMPPEPRARSRGKRVCGQRELRAGTTSATAVRYAFLHAHGVQAGAGTSGAGEPLADGASVLLSSTTTLCTSAPVSTESLARQVT